MLDMIRLLRGKVNQVRADFHQWKRNMDQGSADKEDMAAQLASAEAKLWDVEVKGLAEVRKIEGLEAELVKSRTKATQAKAEAVQAKADVA